MALFGLTTNYNFKLIDFDIATWHDDEYDNWRAVDALLKTFIAAPNFEGVWANSIAYTVGQLVADSVDGNVYECLVGHTSAATPTLFSADRTANPSYWQVWLIAHTGDTLNPHAVTAAQVVNFDLFANRPAAGTADLVFVATDTRTIYRDNGTTWDEIGRDPALILAADLGFDPATQAELDTHAADLTTHLADVGDPHSVTKTQVGLGNVDDVQQQPLDATLTAFAALSGVADRLAYFTGADAFSLATLTVAGRNLLDDANTTAQRATLGLVIGTDVLPEITLVTQGDAEAGTATAEKIWSAQRVKQAIAALPPSGLAAPDFTSSEQTVTASTLLNVAHSLGAVPTHWSVVLRCKTTQIGYSVGDEVVTHHTVAADQGMSFSVDATNMTVVQGSAIAIKDQVTPFNTVAITAASWKWVMRAWL